MDVPFYIQYRHKLPEKANCVQSVRKGEDVAKGNIHSSCVIQYYLTEVETKCLCSMRRTPKNTPVSQQLPVCNVWTYFHCVEPLVLHPAYEASFSPVTENGSRLCPTPCDTVDFTAWQDMQELTPNILPPAVDTSADEESSNAQNGVEMGEINDEDLAFIVKRRGVGWV